MKKILLLSGAMLTALAACNDDYNDQFHLDSTIEDVKDLKVELSNKDYEDLANLEANQELALSKDPEGKTYVEALKEVGSNKYFSQMIPGEIYLPAYLDSKYTQPSNGSVFTVSGKRYKQPAEYLKDFEAVKDYTLSKEDYKQVWGNYTKALFLSPASLSKIPAVLKESIKEPAEGDIVVVNYAYSATEPSFGDQAPIIYKQVKEFDGEEGNYVIVAQSSKGVYYPFGKLEKESYNYGYMKPAPIKVENGVIAGADGADQVVTLHKTAKGFALQNGWGKYIYMSGNHDSFNMSAGMPEEAGDWKIEANGDGTFSIVNLEKGKTVKLNYYEPNDSYSFGAYAEEKFAGKTYYKGVNKDTQEGGFKASDVTLPTGQNFVWKFEDGKYGTYWKASGHVGGKEGSDEVSESWLVSQQIDLTEAKAPQLSMEMVLNFLKEQKRSDCVGIYVAEDFADNVATATWKELEVPAWPEGTNYDRVKSGNIDLSAYCGKKINVAFKYVSSKAAAPTWQISDVMIADLSNYWNVCLFKEYEDNGAVASRASRASEVAANAAAVYAYNKEAWAPYEAPKGVNVVAVDASVYASLGQSSLAKPDQVIANYLSLNYPYAEDRSQMAVLYKNTSSTIAVKEYTKEAGAWNATLPYEKARYKFIKKDGSYELQPNTYIEESLLGSTGGFQTKNITIEGVKDIWKNDKKYGWVASGHADKDYNVEGWLVSRAIDLSEASAPSLVFDAAINFLGTNSREDHLVVKVSTNYDGDVTSCTWTDLTVTGWSEGNSWDFVTVEPVDLTAYVGQQIYIAFKYVGKETCAPKVEIKNFVIGE